MRAPEKMPLKPLAPRSPSGIGQRRAATADTNADRAGLTQAGCCAQVCVPVLGCHCVTESPFC